MEYADFSLWIDREQLKRVLLGVLRDMRPKDTVIPFMRTFDDDYDRLEKVFAAGDARLIDPNEGWVLCGTNFDFAPMLDKLSTREFCELLAYLTDSLVEIKDIY